MSYQRTVVTSFFIIELRKKVNVLGHHFSMANKIRFSTVFLKYSIPSGTEPPAFQHTTWPERLEC